MRAARCAHRRHRARRAPRPLANAPPEPSPRLDLRLLHRRGSRRGHGTALCECPRAGHGARGPAARAARRAGLLADDLGSAPVASRGGRDGQRTPDAGSVRWARRCAGGGGDSAAGDSRRRWRDRERLSARGGRARRELCHRRQGHERTRRPAEPADLRRRSWRRIHLFLRRAHRRLGRGLRDPRHIGGRRSRDGDGRSRPALTGAHSGRPARQVTRARGLPRQGRDLARRGRAAGRRHARGGQPRQRSSPARSVRNRDPRAHASERRGFRPTRAVEPLRGAQAVDRAADVGGVSARLRRGQGCDQGTRGRGRRTARVLRAPRWRHDRDHVAPGGRVPLAGRPSGTPRTRRARARDAVGAVHRYSLLSLCGRAAGRPDRCHPRRAGDPRVVVGSSRCLG